MANWAELQDDLLVLIAARVTLFEDFVAFGGVCASWRLAMVAIKKNFNRLPQVPWLMLAEEEEDDDISNGNGSNLRGFYSLTKCKIHRVELPEASGKRCFFSQGWLITIGKYEEDMNLLHPLSRVQIELPNLTKFSNLEEMATAEIGTGEMYLTFIQNVVLSCSPSSDNVVVVMVIHGALSKLAFHKTGDDAWTTVETRMAQYLDLICYEGQFYAVDCRGRVVVCDVNGPCPTIAQIVSMMPNGFVRLIEKLYLVESLGKLLVVSREGIQVRGDDYNYGTTRFQVFELNVNNGNWAEVQSLGDRALFLGYNSSISVQADIGCKANCIYFTDDSYESYLFTTPNGGGKDMGIYNLLDGSIEPHFQGHSFSYVTPPLWVAPSFF